MSFFGKITGESVTLTANAKINIILSVESKRDDGYHLLDSVFQSVSLGDRLKLTKSENISIRSNVKELENEANIAFKAAELFFRETALKGGVKIRLIKRIPTAAGVGGGSADAAAVLLGLDRLYGTKLSKERLMNMALNLGADVPFFLEGGTVRASGVGERLERLPDFKEGFFILLKTEAKPSTKEMYDKLDAENPPKPKVDEFVRELSSGNINNAIKLFDNSFKACWRNSKTEQILKETADSVSLSGSGPTWFGFYEDERTAQRAYKKLKKLYEDCFLVRPADKAIIFE